ncbi:MAG TPA: hypothetical protein VIH05_08215 [Tepidiformaceae bacterium]
MSRAIIRTWLPLDRWREYFGINPLHFAQAFSAKFPGQDCGDVWFQYAWQHSNQVGRHELASAIHSAEKAIADQVKYNLIPDWTAAEKVKLPRPARREVYFADVGNIRGQARSLEVQRGHLIAPGYRVKQTITTGLAFARADNDGDSYDEDCLATFATAVTDPCEIRIYYPGHEGEDEWEIRPATVEIAAGIASVSFKAWLAIDPDLQEGLAPGPIDGDVSTNYITTVDVYRVYTDPSTEGQMVWEGSPGSCGACVACSVGLQDACVGFRDEEMGYVTLTPATYADGEWTPTALATCRAPDRARLYYLSGWQAQDVACSMKDMDRYWLEAVARYAAALLDRPVCSCNNTENFIKEQQRDIAAVRTGIIFQVSNDSQVANPFGTWVGALFAWMRVNGKGRALPK